MTARYKGVTLVGGAPVSRADIDWASGYSRRFVAADGGARALLDAGRTPEAVIGDLDSIDAETRARLDPELIIEAYDQNFTDFEKCLDRIEAERVIALGFLGARLDHSLAVLSAMAQRPRACLALGPDDVVFAAHPGESYDIALDPGTRVSLYPLRATGGVSQGLVWPIDGLDLHPMSKIATSNRAEGPVRLSAAAPGLIVLLPRSAADAALDAVSNSAR